LHSIHKDKTKTLPFMNAEIIELEEKHKLNYKQVVEIKNERLWQALSRVNLRTAIAEWIETITNPCTKSSYTTSMKELLERGFLNPNWSLQIFGVLSANAIIDKIKVQTICIKNKTAEDTKREWSIRTKEARISCLLAFTRYLSRKTEGIIAKATPNRTGLEKTFSPPSKKVKTEALSRAQLYRFLEELERINPRDALIAKLCLHGAKRINEVLSLEVYRIDFEKRQILFRQSKSKLTDDFTVINFEKEGAQVLLQKLKDYVQTRKGLVFLTKNNKGVKKTQVDRNFSKAGKNAQIPFRVSAHNLRTTAITLWKEDGFSDSLIMKASGHFSSEMVHRYDRTDIADNVTSRSYLL
jgi:integrase/recombinase XerD